MRRQTIRRSTALFTLVVCALLSTAASAGERYSIRGKVIRSEDDTPLAGARVFTLPPTHVSCTRSDGTYVMGNIHVKRAYVYIYKRGYGLRRSQVLFGGSTRQRTVDMVLDRETSENRIAGPSKCKPKRRLVRDDEMWIAGRVIKESNGRPLRGATITTQPATRRVRTNVFGHYAILVPKKDHIQRYVVRARKGPLRGRGVTNMPTHSPYTRFIDMLMRVRKRKLSVGPSLPSPQHGLAFPDFALGPAWLREAHETPAERPHVKRDPD